MEGGHGSTSEEDKVLLSNVDTDTAAHRGSRKQDKGKGEKTLREDDDTGTAATAASYCLFPPT